MADSVWALERKLGLTGIFFSSTVKVINRMTLFPTQSRPLGPKENMVATITQLPAPGNQRFLALMATGPRDPSRDPWEPPLYLLG